MLENVTEQFLLRTTKRPLSLFRGHRKAVSYVKFLNNGRELVSASTDSQLKLWDLDSRGELGKKCEANAGGDGAAETDDDDLLHAYPAVRSFTGHVNEKNFVGLATDGDFFTCGSENNSLYVYYKGLEKPLLHYK